MTVTEIATACGFEPLLLPDPTREIGGAYAGDLLSWVMGRAKEDDLFVTIMTNVNVVAVAALAELSCVVFAEGVPIGDEILDAARQKGINLLRSNLPMYECCVAVGRCLG